MTLSAREYVRPQAAELVRRYQEPRRFIQLVAGARQVGKTTLATQVVSKVGLPHVFASADEPTLRGPAWLDAQWDAARLLLRDAGPQWALLVLDEVQKIPLWSESVKRLWDADARARRPLKVVLLGSSPLLPQRGLTESLAGRFEVLHLPHWSFTEMGSAFGWPLEPYLFYGGYPGAAALVVEPQRWARYVRDALIETTIARDVLLLSRVEKPALLRRLFELGCAYSGQILSYTKMLGQLHDAGNTTTLAHYLDLLAGAGMLTGLQKYAAAATRQRGSSPKLQVFNTALMTSSSGLSLAEARRDREFWGRLVESAVGAHLVNAAAAGLCQVFYWRDRNYEVDFVVKAGKQVTAIEGQERTVTGLIARSGGLRPRLPEGANIASGRRRYRRRGVPRAAGDTLGGALTLPTPSVTIHATHSFSVEHWDQDRQQSGRKLLGAAESWLDSGILAFQVHGWRYSRPMQAGERPCLIVSHDPPLVIAGDGFAGPRVEGAALSGRAAAEAILTGAS